MSFPVILTETTSLLLTFWRKSVNAIFVSLPPAHVDEKFQINNPNTMRSTQNNKLLRVEFKLRLLNALLSRVSRRVRAPGSASPRRLHARRPKGSDRRYPRPAAGSPVPDGRPSCPPGSPVTSCSGRPAPAAGICPRGPETLPPGPLSRLSPSPTRQARSAGD